MHGLEVKKPSILKLAFGGGTPIKAFFTACIVGTILTAINHGDMILMGEFPDPLKVALTYCVPYCVTTWGAITGKLHQLVVNVQEFFNPKRIIDLSFFNFENAITAAYYASENMKIIKANKNFCKFFPFLGDIQGLYFPEILSRIGLSREEIKRFEKEIQTKGTVFIPKIQIIVNGEERIFSLLSTKTSNNIFGYLNGIQGQLVDTTTSR